MKKKVLSIGLAMVLGCTLLAGCSSKFNPNETPVIGSLNEEETVEVDYSKAPSSQTFYVGKDLSTIAIPDESVVETQNNEVPEVPLEEGQTYEPVFTSTEVNNIQEKADVEIHYDGNKSMTFSATDEEGSLDLYTLQGDDTVVSFENPYDEITPYVTEVAFDDSVTKLGAGTLRGFDQPINVVLPESLEEIDENFICIGTDISGFKITGESDTLKVIDNALYIYREDLGGWALARYATASTASSFVLPDEINVVYIYPEAFAWNNYLEEIDISASPDIKLGYNAFAAIPALYVKMDADTDPSYIYENSGCTFKYFTIGSLKTNCEELGFATLEPEF